MSADTPRRIIVFRHAKADWPQVPDHDRPLADRGRHQAPVAGRWLADSGINPDYVLCSSALRTRETWKLAAHELPKRLHRKTVYEDRVYEASPGEIIRVLQETPDEHTDLLLVGHNPGVLGLTQILAGDQGDREAFDQLRLGGFPTAAVAVLSFVGPWKSIEPGVARLDSFYAPPE